jgi:MFS family permease
MDSGAPQPLTDDEISDEKPIKGQEQSLRQQVLRNRGVRALIGSRFAAALGISTLAYGAMVYLATIEAPQLLISLVGATRFLAALLFGIGGGALVDVMSKRTAIVTAYTVQAAACFVIPTVWGTSIASLVVLVFVVASLGQLAIPAVKAATALVSTVAQVAVVAAVISVASGIGAAMGSAFLAPLLINLADLQTIIYVAGVILALGAVRSLWLPREATSTSLLRAARQVEWRRAMPSLRRTAEWLSANRVVGALLLVGAMGMALFESLNTLMPVYVRDVLESDPTNTVFILAPGGIGFMAGTVLGPWLMDRRGERSLAAIALLLLILGFVLFGLIDLVAPLLAPVSPLRILGLVGIELSPAIQAAGLISVFTALGSTTAIAAVQTYVNRYVLLAHQPTTFGMQEVLENALILFAVLGLGIVANLVGSRLVFILAPPLIIAVVIWIIRICFRIVDEAPPEARVIARKLLDTSPDARPGDISGATPEP